MLRDAGRFQGQLCGVRSPRFPTCPVPSLSCCCLPPISLACAPLLAWLRHSGLTVSGPVKNEAQSLRCHLAMSDSSPVALPYSASVWGLGVIVCPSSAATPSGRPWGQQFRAPMPAESCCLKVFLTLITISAEIQANCQIALCFMSATWETWDCLQWEI